MYPKGVIYTARKPRSSGELILRPGKIVKFFYKTFRTLGAGLIAFSIVALIFSFYPIIKEEINYTVRTENPQKTTFGDLIERSKAGDMGLDSYFSVYIPRLNAKANVIPNVNPGNQKEYLTALQDGVAHAKGTNFPGQNKLIYLFSHSTDSPLNFARYNAVFYLLRKLEPGDRVILYFMDQEYEYVVAQKLVTSAKDTSWLIDKEEGEKLVLQTCDPPGTTFKRLIVVAKPI